MDGNEYDVGLKVWVQQWEETYEDFGSCPDGVSLHISEKELAKYRVDLMKAINKYFIETCGIGKNLSYNRPTEIKPYQVVVSQWLHDCVIESSGGLRLMPFQLEKLKSEGHYGVVKNEGNS